MSARRVARSFLLSILMLIPAGLRADDPVDVVDVLRQAIEAYESGDRVAALADIRRAGQAIREEERALPAGVLSNLAALDDALSAYQFHAYGRRPDLDGQADAVARILAGIRRAYRTSSHGVHTDADGRVSSLGALRVDYHPFSARIRQLGTIRIDYEAFSERPRRIGDIELRWVFDELRAIAGVDVR